MKIIIIFPDDARLENTCQKITKGDAWLENMPKTCSCVWKDLRRVFKSVRASVWMNRYQFAGPLRQSHPAKSLSAVREDLGKHGTVEHSIPLEQISFFPNLHCQPSPPFGLRKLMTAPCESHPLYNSSWDGRSVRRNIGMCTRQIFPGLTQN